MTEQEILEVLRKSPTVPEVVDRKFEEALKKVSGCDPEESLMVVHAEKESDEMINGKGFLKRLLPAAAAVFLTCGVMAGAAGLYREWSSGLQNEMGLDDEQATAAEARVNSQWYEETVESEGISITAVQTLHDERTLIAVFNISGLEVPQGTVPSFDGLQVLVDGKDIEKGDGLVYTSYGIRYLPEEGDWWDCYHINADGTFSDVCLVKEDGSIDFSVAIASPQEDAISNHEYQINLSGLGIANTSKAWGQTYEQNPELWAAEPCGEWSFSLDIGDSEAERCTYVMDDGVQVVTPFGGVKTIKEVTVDSLSVYLTYKNDSGNHSNGLKMLMLLKDGTLAETKTFYQASGMSPEVTMVGDQAVHLDGFEYYVFGGLLQTEPSEVAAILDSASSMATVDDPLSWLSCTCIPLTEGASDLFDEKLAEAEMARKELNPGEYADGIYTATTVGAAPAGSGNVNVTVTIEGGMITAIEIDAPKDNESLGATAIRKLPGKIIEMNGINGVNVIAGCSLTSQAILDAVAACLEEAAK